MIEIPYAESRRTVTASPRGLEGLPEVGGCGRYCLALWELTPITLSSAVDSTWPWGGAPTACGVGRPGCESHGAGGSFLRILTAGLKSLWAKEADGSLGVGGDEGQGMQGVGGYSPWACKSCRTRQACNPWDLRPADLRVELM